MPSVSRAPRPLPPCEVNFQSAAGYDPVMEGGVSTPVASAGLRMPGSARAERWVEEDRIEDPRYNGPRRGGWLGSSECSITILTVL